MATNERDEIIVQAINPHYFQEFITREIDQLRDLTHDPEAAHGKEDFIRELVLNYLSMHVDIPKGFQDLARLALSTRDIKFERWAA